MQKGIFVGGGGIALALVVGGLAWLALSDSPDAVAAAPSAAAPAALAERPDPTPDTALRPPRAADDSAAPAESPTVPTRVDVEATATENELAVRVVDQEDTPLADVEVLVLPRAGETELEPFEDLERVDAFFREHATPRRTNTRGLLHIARPAGSPTLLVATHGRLWGKLRVDPGADAAELMLEPDATLRARVVDASGRPVAGATVQLRTVGEWGRWAARHAETEGARASVTFRHAQRTLVAHDDRVWEMGVEALLERPVAEPLELDALPTDEIALVLPVTGAVEVTVLDESWQPFAGKARASIGIVREGQARELSPFSGTRRPEVQVQVEDAVARFPFVDIGRELEVKVARESARVSTRAFGPGPLQAGATAHFEIRMGSDHPVVMLRAVDADGEALGSQALNVRVDMSTRHMVNTHDMPVVTEDDGHFFVDVEGKRTEGSTRSLIVSRGPTRDPEISGEVDLALKLELGLNDLGHVMLTAAPLFVRGRVVTPGGDPIPAAELVLEKKSESQPWWNQDWRFNHESDEEGAFEVRGQQTGIEFRLGASREGWAGLSREFAPGETNLALELTREGVLEGQVLVNAGVPVEMIQVEVAGQTDVPMDSEIENRRFNVEHDGTFRIGRLHAGAHTVKLHIESHREQLREFTGVAVQSGQVTRDPRLNVVDLRSELFSRRITLLTPGDTDRRLQGRMLYGPPGAEELEGNRWFHEREIDLISRDEVVDVLVTARGFRTERIEGVYGDVEVSLSSGVKVTLVLRSDTELPEPPLYVKAVLTPVEGQGDNIDWGVEAFGESREIETRVPGSGEMKVTWIVERRSSGSSSAMSTTLDDPQLVTVTGQSGQVIEIDVTDEQMQEIVGRLR
jgi:hypothetical protein